MLAFGQSVDGEDLADDDGALLLAAPLPGEPERRREPEQVRGERGELDAQRLFGPHAEAVITATQGYKGPQRALEVALRSGPYGDQFGLKPDGLTLAKVMASNASGGIDLGALQPRIPEMLRTPSGKVELAPPSLLQDLQRPAHDLRAPAPDLVIIGRRDVRTNNSWMHNLPVLAKPQVADGPTSMQIIGRRQVRSGNSWMHNLPVLAKGPFRCTALVHPVDAARMGLQDGALARINAVTRANEAPRSVQAQVHVSEQMMPGVVSLPHGWGHDLPGAQLHVAAERPGANLNALLDDQLRDPLSGNAVLGGVAITMAAVA